MDHPIVDNPMDQVYTENIATQGCGTPMVLCLRSPVIPKPLQPTIASSIVARVPLHLLALVNVVSLLDDDSDLVSERWREG